MTLAGVGKGIAVTSGAGAFLGGLSANDIAAVVGVLGVVAGLVMQWYFNRRKDKREAEAHRATMAESRARLAEINDRVIARIGNGNADHPAE